LSRYLFLRVQVMIDRNACTAEISRRTPRGEVRRGTWSSKNPIGGAGEVEREGDCSLLILSLVTSCLGSLWKNQTPSLQGETLTTNKNRDENC